MSQRPQIPTISRPDISVPRLDDTSAGDTLLESSAAAPRPTLDLREDAVRARGSVGLSTARMRARGTPVDDPTPLEDKLRTLIYAAEPNRAKWIESELMRAPVTIQMARKVRTVVAALLKDPPPRPQLLIVDFDAISPGELFELHAIRHDHWTGRVIGLGAVPTELRMSLGVEHAFEAPLVRDSLLDYVAGTRHAAVTVAVPVVPPRDHKR